MNVGTPEIFEEAQIRVLGEDHVAPMIAFGTLKKKSAFKLYAKAKNMEFTLANEISSQITKYDEAVKFAEDDAKDLIDIYDFVDEQYKDYLEQSKEYWGIVSDKKKAPSAYLLYQGNIRKEIGLIKCKSESTKKEYITCVIDGAIAENYKFLKNDVLKVDSVLLINKVFDRIGMKPFDVNTLTDNVIGNSKVWDIYSNGYTICVNQVEQPGSKRRCTKYKPHNISELSAFIAAIRPGFKSMYNKFEARENFSYGIDALDNLLRTEELPVSFIFFQEQVMTVLNYAGFPMDQCYGMIKAIAKKHPEKVKPLKEKFIVGFRDRLIEEEKLSEKAASDCADRVWQVISDNCGYSFNCVSGSTRIVRGAKNHRFCPTIEEMYKIRNDKRYAYLTGHSSLYDKYNREGYGQALSMCEDEKLRPNRIVAIKPAGIRQTYTVKTKSGCQITCTDNHKFPTKNGEVQLKDLCVGDLLYCKGKYVQKYFNCTLTDGNYEHNFPKKGQCGFVNNDNGASVVYLSERQKHVSNKDSCEICGKHYSDEKRFELHHKDFDRHNNCPENYQWLCVSCHKKIHYQNGRTKRYENGIDTYLDEIVSIEAEKVEQVYDIEMDDPFHTFVSESGLVTSNSSHAYCMALDSLYQAWQKAYYPYEFYEVMLQHYSDKGNKDKVSLIKEEMKQAFGITEGTYGFRNDHRKFTLDKESHCIHPALSSIKGIGNKAADDLYSIRENKYDSFVNLLDDINEKTSIDSKELDILTKLGFFSEFGGTNKLLRIIDMYSTIKDRKQLKVDSLQAIGIPEFVVDKCSKKKTPKLFKDFDWKELLCEWINVEEFKEDYLWDKLFYEKEFLGYLMTTISNISDCYYFVTAISGEKTRRITLYQISTGDTVRYKVKGKIFDNNPICENDILSISNISLEKKWAKDASENWIRLEEREEWATKYSIVRRKE